MWHQAGTLRTVRYESYILKNVSCCLASVQFCNDYLVTQLLSIIIRDSYSDLQNVLTMTSNYHLYVYIFKMFSEVRPLFYMQGDVWATQN